MVSSLVSDSITSSTLSDDDGGGREGEEEEEEVVEVVVVVVVSEGRGEEGEGGEDVGGGTEGSEMEGMLGVSCLKSTTTAGGRVEEEEKEGVGEDNWRAIFSYLLANISRSFTNLEATKGCMFVILDEMFARVARQLVCK